MRFVKQNLHTIILVFIVAAGIYMRAEFYESPGLSIATNDTDSYISSSQAPLFSWESMTGRRLLTTNIIYKFFEPEGGYVILANGSVNTSSRVIQPGFDNITRLQFLLSMLGWAFLALSVSSHIKSIPLKVLSATLILLFGFTPQIADWDSILMSESLTFSLFALQFSLLINFIFLSGEGRQALMIVAGLGWVIVQFFWTFLRDTNLFAVLVTIGMLSLLYLYPNYRKNIYPGIIIILLAGIFLLGWQTARNSPRSSIEMMHVYNSELLPFPLRVSNLQEMGMPAIDSPEFQPWFQEHSVNTFVKFMLTHPGYVIFKMTRDIQLTFGENMQPYFLSREHVVWRQYLITFGESMHPESATVFLVDIILLFGLLHFGWRNATDFSRTWAWIGAWLFLVASLTIFASIMGGAAGLYRHTLFSTMTYRLFMWIFLVVIIDLGLDRQEIRSEQSSSQS